MKVLQGIKSVAGLVVVAFMVLVVCGIYTALDSAGSLYAKPAVAQAKSLQPDEILKPKQATALFVETLLEQTSNEGAVIDSKAVSTPEAPETETVSPATNQAAKSASVASEVAATATPKTSSEPVSTPAAPTKAPVWIEPVYENVEHEAETKTNEYAAQYKTVTDYYTCCGDCDFEVQGSIYPHQDETGHGRYRTDVPFDRKELVREAWTETVTIKEAWTEKKLIKEGYWA